MNGSIFDTLDLIQFFMSSPVWVFVGFVIVCILAVIYGIKDGKPR